MRLPEAQEAALAHISALFPFGYTLSVFKWTHPTHLFGYRVEAMNVLNEQGQIVMSFSDDNPDDLVVCALYERLVLAFYDGTSSTVSVSKQLADLLIKAVNSLSNDPLADKCVVLFGNVVDGISMTGPFDNSTCADAWVEEHASKADYVLAPLKHPEA